MKAGPLRPSSRRSRPRAAAEAATGSATYAYCVVRAEKPPDLRTAPRGLPGAGPPRALAAGGRLWLVVADAPLDRYGQEGLERLVRDLQAVSPSALAHSAVVAHCARHHPTLPLRLFTLFATDRRAVTGIARRRALLATRLSRVANRVEWGVQARVEATAGRRAATRREGVRKATRGLSPGTRFLALRRLERDATRQQTAGARTAAAGLYRALATQADGARRRPPVSVSGAALLLDAAFLVPRARAATFRAAVRREATRVAGHGLHVRLTGPWPPYSFVAGRL